MVKIKNKGHPSGLDKRWLSVREVMDKEGISRSAVYRAITDNKVPAKEVVSSWIIDTASVLYKDWVEAVNTRKESVAATDEARRDKLKAVWADPARREGISRKMVEAHKRRKV